jgi:hypothetical protein
MYVRANERIASDFNRANKILELESRAKVN